MSESTERIIGYLGKEKDQREIDDTTLDARRDDVLLFITRKGVSFPTEIAREVDLNIEGVNRILYNLKKLNFIDKIHPDPHSPQKMFMQRMSELWLQGIWGYERFAKMSWWFTTEGGVEFIKTKYKKQGKPVASSLVRYLGLEVEGETR